MAENVLLTLQHLVQDVVAPDVRELKAIVQANQEITEAKLERILAEIRASRAEEKAVTTGMIAALSERIAVLETKLASKP
ncbi:MAG TPA: hypothetical protein VK670_14290 [Silvibacterium sp.]|nr:hypothetical protein [Silvibacterium sp.]